MSSWFGSLLCRWIRNACAGHVCKVICLFVLKWDARVRKKLSRENSTAFCHGTFVAVSLSLLENILCIALRTMKATNSLANNWESNKVNKWIIYYSCEGIWNLFLFRIYLPIFWINNISPTHYCSQKYKNCLGIFFCVISVNADEFSRYFVLYVNKAVSPWKRDFHGNNVWGIFKLHNKLLGLVDGSVVYFAQLIRVVWRHPITEMQVDEMRSSCVDFNHPYISGRIGLLYLIPAFWVVYWPGIRLLVSVVSLVALVFE
jgi:hypothetical protein